MKHKTPTSMKFKKLKRRLGLPSYAVAGLLEMLWVTTQVNTPRGDIGKFTNEEIAIELEWEGDPDELIAALVATGWLDESKKHRLIIHNWPDHAPRYIHGIVTKCGGFVSDYSEPVQSTTIDPDCTEEQPNLTQPDVKDETQPNQTKPKRFIRPTLDQVIQYCTERKNRVDAQEFIDHYEANGWIRGKTPVKDWKACVRTWEHSTNEKPHRPRLPTPEENAAWRP